jgi:hypothetical protein
MLLRSRGAPTTREHGWKRGLGPARHRADAYTMAAICQLGPTGLEGQTRSRVLAIQ